MSLPILAFCMKFSPKSTCSLGWLAGIAYALAIAGGHGHLQGAIHATTNDAAWLGHSPLSRIRFERLKAYHGPEERRDRSI